MRFKIFVGGIGRREGREKGTRRATPNFPT